MCAPHPSRVRQATAAFVFVLIDFTPSSGTDLRRRLALCNWKLGRTQNAIFHHQRVCHPVRLASHFSAGSLYAKDPLNAYTQHIIIIIIIVAEPIPPRSPLCSYTALNSFDDVHSTKPNARTSNLISSAKCSNPSLPLPVVFYPHSLMLVSRCASRNSIEWKSECARLRGFSFRGVRPPSRRPPIL